MKKIISWLDSHSDRTKILLILGFGIWSFDIWLNIDKYLYILTDYGFDLFIGRLLGLFIGSFGITLLASIFISLFPYLLFRSIAEEYKHYLDYFSIVFLILGIITIFSHL